VNQLTASFKGLDVRHELPLRPGFGTLGKPITLRANFFPVRIPKGPIYDYNVEITPKTEINRLKTRIFELLELSPLCAPHMAYIAHDRSERLVSARELPQPLDIQVPFYEEGQSGPRPDAKVYNISIKLTREIDGDNLTQCVTISNRLFSLFMNL
jgi:eukaryotic translation initiation factor 2C